MSSLKTLYREARKKYLRNVREYEREGFQILEKFKPTIPKKITQGSIRRLEKLQEELRGNIHEQKYKVGYYEKKRQERERKYQNRAKGKYPKKFTPPTGPKVSDAILRQVESEIAIASSFIARSKPYEEAVREAANELTKATPTRYGFNTYEFYLEMLNDEMSIYESRVKLAKIIGENWNEHFQKLEDYLYDFQSDGGGELIHTDRALQMFRQIMDAIGQEITDEQFNQIMEEMNDSNDGNVSNVISGDYV